MYFDLSRQDVSLQKHSRNGIRAIKRLNVILEAFRKIVKLINVKEESPFIHFIRTIIDSAFGIWTSATNTSLSQFVSLDGPLVFINKQISALSKWYHQQVVRQSCEWFLCIRSQIVVLIDWTSALTLMCTYFIVATISILSFASFKF